MDQDDINYIASRYRKNRFATDKALKRIGLSPRRLWTPLRAAAAVAAVVAMTATAALIYRNYALDAVPQDPQTAAPATGTQTMQAQEIRVIDFEDTPLTQVVEKIKSTYGVTVTNIPQNAEEYHLSLHYEGTADDLIDTINEILGTDLKTDIQ